MELSNDIKAYVRYEECLLQQQREHRRQYKREHNKRYRESHREKLQAYHAEWRKNNPNYFHDYYIERLKAKRQQQKTQSK